MRDIACDADDILDQGPFGVGNRVGRAEYVDGPGFMSIALTVLIEVSLLVGC